jgi:hypothetical protein
VTQMANGTGSTGRERVRQRPPEVSRWPADAPEPAGLDAGLGPVAVRFAFDLLAGADRARPVAAFLRAEFDDQRVRPLDLRVPDAGPAGGSVAAIADGVVGWLFGDPLGDTPIPAHCVAHAALAVPLDRTELTATLRVDTTVVRRASWPLRPARDHLVAAPPSRFRLALPASRSTPAEESTPAEVSTPAAPSTPVARASVARASAGVRLCVAADLERFSRFRLPEATRSQQRFVTLLARARAHAGIDEAGVALQESGDGQFAVLPAGIDETDTIPRLVAGLRIAIADTNSDLAEPARLRLRVALHRGHVAPAANGWAGDAAIAVHRLLDCTPVRDALSGAPAADFALIVSDVLYQEVIGHRYGLLDPDRFRRVEVVLPVKGFQASAWVYTPD